MNKTQVLLVEGFDDFNALAFEERFGGTKVIDIINNLEDYQDDDCWELSVHTFKNVDPEFAKFVKTYIQDYDDSKNKNFYLDNEVIE